MPHVKFKRVGENVTWLVADRLFRMGMGVVVLGMVARYLGPAQFGVLNYSISLTAIFAAVASLGIEGIVIRELVKAPERRSAILGTAFVLRLLGGGVALSLVFLAGWLTSDVQYVAPLAVVVALAFFPQAFEVIDLWFQKNIQSKYTVLAKSGAVLIGSAIKIGLVAARAPLILFAAALALDAVFAAIALAIMYHRRGEHMRNWSVSREIARNILRDSWPLILSGILVAIYMRVEQVLVMMFFGSTSAGIYFAAVRMTEIWQFIPGFILASLYPLLVEKRQQNADAYLQKLQLVFDLLTGFGLVVAVGITVIGPYLLPLIFGAKFVSAVPILTILAWTAPITFSGGVRAQYFLIEGFTIYHTASALIGIATNVTLAVLLMPRYGIQGAALGALGGYFVSAYVTSWLFPCLRNCARLQTKALFVFFRWRETLRNIG
jgi:PST family polysaccharide transporter